MNLDRKQIKASVAVDYYDSVKLNFGCVLKPARSAHFVHEELGVQERCRLPAHLYGPAYKCGTVKHQQTFRTSPNLG